MFNLVEYLSNAIGSPSSFQQKRTENRQMNDLRQCTHPLTPLPLLQKPNFSNCSRSKTLPRSRCPIYSDTDYVTNLCHPPPNLHKQPEHKHPSTLPSSVTSIFPISSPLTTSPPPSSIPVSIATQTVSPTAKHSGAGSINQTPEHSDGSLCKDFLSFIFSWLFFSWLITISKITTLSDLQTNNTPTDGLVASTNVQTPQ